MPSLYVVVVVSLFMAVGPGLMVVNKEILSTVDFPYPLLVSSMGLVFAAITTHTMKALGHLTLEYEDHVTQKFWLSKCLPVGICHAATLAFGNAQYMHSGMALIQFMKSFTPCITAIVTFFLLNRRESYASAAALVVLCAGTTLAAGATGGEVTQMGFALAIGSSLTEAVRLVMTDFLLSGVKMKVLESLYYLSPAGGACLFAVGCAIEGPLLLAKGHQYRPLQHPFTFLAAASMGLGVQLLTTHVIKATSAVSLKVLSQVRNTIPVLYGVAVYQEIVTVNQLTGYLVSLGAFAGYTYIKMQPKPAAPPAAPPPAAAVPLEEGPADAAAKRDG